MKILTGVVSSRIKVTAIFKESVDGTVVAVCPELPGCAVEGRSRRDAVKKIKAAVEGCLIQLLSDAQEKMLNKKRRTASPS